MNEQITSDPSRPMSYGSALRAMVSQFETDKVAAQGVWHRFEIHHISYRCALSFSLAEARSLCEFARWRSAVGLDWDLIGDKLGRTVWAHNGVVTLGIEGRSFLLCARPNIIKPRPLAGTSSGLMAVCISHPECNAYIQRSQPTEVNFAILTEVWHEKVVEALTTGLYVGESAERGAPDAECPCVELLGDSDEHQYAE